MRCSHRSTTWRGSGLAAVALVGLANSPAPAPPNETAITTAIVAAVRARMGREAAVEVTSLKTKMAAAVDRLVATPAPGGRLGAPIRFTLWASERATRRPTASRLGYATAIVRVSIEHVTTTRWVPRGTVLTAADVTPVTRDVGDIPLQRLPTAAAAIGARSRRNLEAGASLTAAVLTVPPLVSSGDLVVTRAVVGPVEAMGRAIARQSGSEGQRIRLVNPDSGRQLQGRVIGKGEVLVHER